MFRNKALQFAAVLLGGSLLASAANSQVVAGKKPVIKPRPTHAESLLRQKPVRDFGEQKTVSREDVLKPTHRNERQGNSLMSRSTIVSSSTDWSMVPKGAVLYVPSSYVKRVNDSRNGKLIGWQEFYGKNRNWIRTVSVTIDQASGKDPLTDESLQALKKGGQVLIAVCQGGPISVNLPKVPEAGAEPADAEAEAAHDEAAKEKAEQEAKSIERLKRRLLQRAF